MNLVYAQKNRCGPLILPRIFEFRLSRLIISRSHQIEMLNYATYQIFVNIYGSRLRTRTVARKFKEVTLLKKRALYTINDCTLTFVQDFK